jgi:hypothetical protein
MCLSIADSPQNTDRIARTSPNRAFTRNRLTLWGTSLSEYSRPHLPPPDHRLEVHKPRWAGKGSATSVGPTSPKASSRISARGLPKEITGKDGLVITIVSLGGGRSLW